MKEKISLAFVVIVIVFLGSVKVCGLPVVINLFQGDVFTSTEDSQGVTLGDLDLNILT